MCALHLIHAIILLILDLEVPSKLPFIGYFYLLVGMYTEKNAPRHQEVILKVPVAPSIFQVKAKFELCTSPDYTINKYQYRAWHGVHDIDHSAPLVLHLGTCAIQLGTVATLFGRLLLNYTAYHVETLVNSHTSTFSTPTFPIRKGSR